MVSQGKRSHEWFIARARLTPNLLAQAPPWVRATYDHPWAPMQAMASQLKCFPDDLWDYLLSQPTGFIVIGKDSRYEPASIQLGEKELCGVAHVAIQDLARNNKRPLHVLSHLIDHHLGCQGHHEGPWMTQGSVARHEWTQAAQRLDRLFALGYGIDPVARANPQDYFAQSLAWYCQDRQKLNTADPQICKWFRSTIWNPSFWERKPRRL